MFLSVITPLYTGHGSSFHTSHNQDRAHLGVPMCTPSHTQGELIGYSPMGSSPFAISQRLLLDYSLTYIEVSTPAPTWGYLPNLRGHLSGIGICQPQGGFVLSR